MEVDEKKRRASGGRAPKAKEAKGAGKGKLSLPASSAASSGLIGSSEQEAAAAKHLSNSLKESRVLMTLMLKQILRNTQDNRDLMGVLFETWLGPATSLVATMAKQQNVRYSSGAKSRGHGLGPPHLYTFAGTLGALAVQAKETACAAEAQGNLDTYSSKAMLEKSEIIKFCRLTPLYEKTKIRVTMSFGVGQEAQACRNSLVKMLTATEGFEYKAGRAPAGFMERELGLWLQALVA